MREGTLRPRTVILGESARLPFFAAWEGSDEFDAARMRWLVALRWLAIGSMGVPIFAALQGWLPGIHYRLIIGVTAFGVVYNTIVQLSVRRLVALVGWRAAIVQTILDLAMLTTVLYALGGVHSPFMGYYVFHVALVAILAGPRAAAVATLMALVGGGFLIVCDLYPQLGAATWNPPSPWGTLTNVVAFVVLLSGTAYIVAHAARDRWFRERKLARARDRAALDYQLLSNTLDELDAGLEVLDEHRRLVFANRRAEELSGPYRVDGRWRCPGESRPCEHDASGPCPVNRAFDEGLPGRCRFVETAGGEERVYEMLTFPLAARTGEPDRLMNLYVDRTDVALGERKLMLAERLASLGRIAQGVAHELNTPLATIRTLATDMRDALGTVATDASLEERARIVEDLDESAALIRDETIRLGKITQALLAGGDLARARIERGVTLIAVVERARALVVAGLRGGLSVVIDPSVAEVRSDVDPDRLMQVLVNLLQNALDAMRTGGGERVVVHAEATDDLVRILVDDDGPGIAPEIRGRLFEPFSTTKPPGQGTGLGLYASYMLARSMGGDLMLESREPRGVRGIVTLPRVRVRGAGLADRPSVAQRPTA